MSDYQTIGTPYFETRTHAIMYYEDQDCDEAYVDYQISTGNIHIGKPEVEEGDKLSLDIMEGRYYVRRKR